MKPNTDKKREFLKLLLAVLVIFTSPSFTGCTGQGASGIALDENADDGSQIGDGGEFNPSADGSVSPCIMNEEGECEEQITDADDVTLSIQSVAYGLNERDAVECETISIPGSLLYEAEIDDVGNAEQFAFLTAAGEYSTERSEGTGSVSICYLRTANGSHTGQLKLVLNADATSSSPYAYVIRLSGETVDKFFTITSPRQGQVVDAREGHNEGRNDDEGDYLLTASGSINLDLTTILKEGLSTPVIVTSAGVPYRADLKSDGSFSTTIGVPQSPGIYTVEFSAETLKDEPLTTELTVVVADDPEFEIIVKDAGGNDISAGTPTDIETLIVGFKVKNLNLAGSSQSEMPVSISSITFNGNATGKDTDIWYDATQSWCGDSGTYPSPVGDDYAGFEASTTYCVPLSELGEIVSGENVIAAKAENGLGSAESSFMLILDYNKPVLKITAPAENELLSPGAGQLKISGSVANYAPLESADTTPAVKNGDTGSYCIPASSEDSACPTSSVQLWINANTAKTPINVYPELTGAYAGLAREELFAKIAEETPERCRTVEGETKCNLPEAEFSFNLPLDGTMDVTVNLYANVMELRAESLADSRSHRTAIIRTFQTGITNAQSFKSAAIVSGTNGAMQKISIAGKGDLTTGSLGSLNQSTGFINRSPVMLNISEGFLKDPYALYVIQKILNDNLPFADLINGWNAMPKEDDDETIDLEADYQRQYKESTGKNYGDFWLDLEDEWQEKFIQQGLHSNTMATKYWALVRYLGYGIQKGWWSVDKAYLNYFEREGDPEKSFNVALDSCNQVISTAFVPIGDLRYVYEHMGFDPEMIPFIPEWPDIAAGNIQFNDFVSGKWIVQSAEFKEGTGNTGTIDLDACVVPANADVDNCEDDIPFKDDLLPAIWGHFVSYNLVEGGLLGPQPLEIDDPTMPLIWSVGKLRIKLKNALKVEKVKVNGEWTNKISIDKDGITQNNVDESDIIIATSPDDPDLSKGDTLHDKSVMTKNSVQIYPYERCRDYYQELLDSGVYHDSGEGWNETPFGCDQNDPEWNYPFILERNSVKGREVYNTLMMGGQSYYLLGVVWQGVMETFAKIVRCTDEETVNPLLNAEAFPYPSWIAETSKMDTSFALDNQEDGWTVVAAKDAKDPLFEIDLNLTQADLNINHPEDPSSTSALTLRLPFSLTANDVTNPVFPLMTSLAKLPGITTGSASANETANRSGHLVRATGQGNLNDYPIAATAPEDDLFGAASLNIEELVNSVAYLIFKKGPLSLLDLFESEDFDPSLLEVNNDYSIGVDKVVLARYDICGSLAGALQTELPPDLLFSNIASQFNYPSLHLDVTLDKNYPPTIAMTPISGYEDTDFEDSVSQYATDIKIALNNVRLSVKELETTDTQNAFSIGREVVQVRVDAVLSLKAIYHPDEMQLNIFVEGYEEQNFHVSVVPGKGGASYDDVDVIYSLTTEIIPNIFSKLGKTFDPRFMDDASGESVTPTFSVKFKSSGDGYVSIHDVDDVEITSYMEEMTNGSCEGMEKPVYASESNSSGFTPALGGVISGPVILKNPGSITSITNSVAKTSTGKTSKSSVALKQINRLEPAVIQNLDVPGFASDGILFGSDCTEKGYVANDDNPLEEALCEAGVKDILFTPNLSFDNDNGYIHLSSELVLKLYDWLLEEMR